MAAPDEPVGDTPCQDAAIDSRFDVSAAHIARVYNYWLGGKDHFAADRIAGDATIGVYPGIRQSAQANRAFLARVVRYLAGTEGIRQFLDIGTGLPTANNTHEVAQATVPYSRIVYVDNDPLVLAHARALLTSSSEGRTAYIHADLRDPQSILTNPLVREVLDFSQPIALVIVAVLHFVPDEYKPGQVLATLIDALPSGSYLVASHITGEHDPIGPATGARAYQAAGLPAQLRDADQFARLAFSGLELVPPGTVLVSEWRSEASGPRPTPAEVSWYGGVARIP